MRLQSFVTDTNTTFVLTAVKNTSDFINRWSYIVSGFYSSVYAERFRSYNTELKELKK